MKILSENDIQLLNTLIKDECEFIEKGFIVSQYMGKTFLRNSITSFIDNYLFKVYGACIPSFSSEYRYFVLGIVNTINSDYLESVIQELLIPTIGMVSNHELLNALSKIGKL